MSGHLEASARGGVPDDIVAALAELVPFLDVEVGPWVPTGPGAAPDAVGLLLVRGLVLQDLSLDRGGATELLGPGDLFRSAGPSELLPFGTVFTVASPARVAVLDGHLPAVLERWPQVGARIVAGAATRLRRQAMHRAVSQLPRVDERLLAMLWLLAERWGRVGPDGVFVELALTHELLGRLIGARRPTVTMAVGQLIEAGHLRRRLDRGYVLAPASRKVLVPRSGRASRVADVELLEPARALDPMPAVAAAPPGPVHVPPVDPHQRGEDLRRRLGVLRLEHRRAMARAGTNVEWSRRLLGGRGPVAD